MPHDFLKFRARTDFHLVATGEMTAEAREFWMGEEFRTCYPTWFGTPSHIQTMAQHVAHQQQCEARVIRAEIKDWCLEYLHYEPRAVILHDGPIRGAQCAMKGNDMRFWADAGAVIEFHTESDMVLAKLVYGRFLQAVDHEQMHTEFRRLLELRMAVHREAWLKAEAKTNALQATIQTI